MGDWPILGFKYLFFLTAQPPLCIIVILYPFHMTPQVFIPSIHNGMNCPNPEAHCLIKAKASDDNEWNFRATIVVYGVEIWALGLYVVSCICPWLVYACTSNDSGCKGSIQMVLQHVTFYAISYCMMHQFTASHSLHCHPSWFMPPLEWRYELRQVY